MMSAANFYINQRVRVIDGIEAPKCREGVVQYICKNGVFVLHDEPDYEMAALIPWGEDELEPTDLAMQKSVMINKQIETRSVYTNRHEYLGELDRDCSSPVYFLCDEFAWNLRRETWVKSDKNSAIEYRVWVCSDDAIELKKAWFDK